jgi:TolA-binding protein
VKRLFLLKKIIAAFIGLLGLGWSPQLIAGPNLAPVLPLPADRDTSFLLERALRDPALVSGMPSDESSAEQLAAEINQIKSTPNADAASLAEAFARMSYFLADLAAGRIESSSDRARAQENLRSTQRNAARFAQSAEKSSKKPGARARMTYLRTVMNYLSNGSTTGIKELGNNSLLSRPLQTRAHILNAQIMMQTGSAKMRTDAIAKLRSRSGLDINAETHARLLLTLHAAGLGVKLNRSKAPEASYHAALTALSKRASDLNSSDQDKLVGLCLSIWRAADGAKIDWSRSPVALRAGSDTRMAAAIQERHALAMMSKNDFNGAAAKFESVSQAISGSPEALVIDQRILSIRQAAFAKSTNAAPYEKTLVRLQQKYSDSQILGSGGEARALKAKEQFAAQHLRLIQAEVKAAKNQNASSQRRSQSIGLASRFIENSDDKVLNERIQSDIAAIYVVNKQYRKGVDIYVDLSLNGNPEFKKTYLRNAIAAQSELATWPAQAPWDAYKAGNASERERLTDLYSQLSKLDSSWPILAHLGLLQVAAGDLQTAFASWTSALENSAAGAHPNQAAGMMMSHYARVKSWPSLENIARVSLKRKLSPVSMRKSVSAGEMLGLALFEGGKTLMAAKDYKSAAEKFSEFSDTYKNDKRRHESMYRLAFCYRGSSQFPESMATLKSMVQQYPNSQLIASALHQGGFWAMEQAMEEDAIYYHQNFLTRFGTDQRASKVRASLLQVYEGRGMYAQANGVYQQVTASKSAPIDRRIKAAVALMQSEDRYGNDARAVIYAEQVLKIARSDAESMGLAYGVMVRSYALNNQFKKIEVLEPKIASLDGSNLAVAEALGAARFYLAEFRSKDAVKEIFSLELKDPMATLNSQYNLFTKTKGTFDQVCSGGESSYCAAAMFKLARLAEDFVNSIEDLQINETLDPDSISSFKARKQSIMDSLATLSADYDDRAEKISRNGMTQPEWTQQILWSNSSDSNFNTLSSKGGHGYIQYQPGAANQIEPALAE